MLLPRRVPDLASLQTPGNPESFNVQAAGQRTIKAAAAR
jgi:hypothetical protein